MTLIKPKSARWRIGHEQLQIQQHQNCLHQPLTKDLGDGYSNICQLDENLSYIETEYTPSRDLALLSKNNKQEPRLIVTLGLKGQSRFASKQGQNVVFKQGYTSISTFSSSEGERQFEANKHILQLRFSVNKKWLRQYFNESKIGQLFKQEALQTLSHKPISTQGMMIAQQLRSCNAPDDIKKIFVHGQAINLLAFELGPLFSSNRATIKRFTQKEKDIVNVAREILLKEFKNPPSVAELSKQVGCNQFKLKALFHHFFNNTPYGVLLEIRMNKAYQLLESTQCHVNIAADYVGYQHASNFSSAFVKFFGVTPKTVAK